MNATYTYIVSDVLSGELLAELPIANVTFGSVLNGVGSFRGEVQLTRDTSRETEILWDLARITRSAVDAVRRCLHVRRDGVLVWGGPIWTTAYDSEKGIVQIQGAEWLSLLRRRRIRDSLSWEDRDQFRIVAELLAYGQAKPGGSLGLGIARHPQNTGITRTQAYTAPEEKEVLAAIEDLSKMNAGFDYAVELDSLTSRTLHVHWPHRGRRATETRHLFELGRNIVALSDNTDGTRAVNSVSVLGVGEGDASLRATVTRDDLLGLGWPLLEDTISAKDEHEQANLDARAEAEAEALGLPVSIPEVTVFADEDPVLGSYITGDEARFIVPPDTDPWWPDGFAVTRRIVAWEASVPDEGGNETVRLTLNLPAEAA